MDDYRALFANYIGYGREFTTIRSGQKERRVRNKISLTLEGYDVELLQNPDILAGQMISHKGRPLRTTDVIVKNVTPSRVRKVKILLNDLASLLSFVSVSAVRNYGHEYPNGSGNGSRSNFFGVTNYCYWPIDIRDGNLVHDFIEKVWPNYKRLKKKRKLPVVFEYLVEAERPSQPMELKLVIAFIVLENLKGTYAQQENIPFKRGRFRKANGASYSFEELLKKMLQSSGMRRGLKRIVTLRNSLIHSGMPDFHSIHSERFTGEAITSSENTCCAFSDILVCIRHLDPNKKIFNSDRGL